MVSAVFSFGSHTFRGRRCDVKLVLVVLVALATIVWLVGVGNSYPAGAFGGGGGGGWGDPATSGTVVIPPWIWSWFGGWLVGHAADPLLNCVTGETGTCTTAGGPVGGGGGGGIPGECESDCSGGGWSRKAPTWSWWQFSEEQH
jgi:hypothetical protein